METAILLAEDEERLRTVVRDYFVAHGVACRTAADGAEALEALRERDYDAVLLDVMMPGPDGFAVCRAVRERSGVPILFLTALGDEAHALRGHRAGYRHADLYGKRFGGPALTPGIRAAALFDAQPGGGPQPGTAAGQGVGPGL